MRFCNPKLWFMISFCMQLFAHNFEYDLLIIGAGESGIAAAKTASAFGRKIGIIQESDTLSNRFINSSIPTKSLIYAGEVAAILQKSSDFGLMLSDNHVSTDHIFQYIHEVVDNTAQNYTIQNLPDKHIHLFTGKASFVDNHTITINGQLISAEKFIIATGGTPYIPTIEGLENVPYFTEDTFFNLNKLPKSIIIIGEGPLGIELTTALHRLGVQVTFITSHGLLLPKYDFELVAKLHRLMKNQGIKIKYHMRIEKAVYENNRVKICCKNKINVPKEYSADALLFALTRSGRVHELNLETIGVKSSTFGIKVNKKMQTSVPNIFACGNAVGQMHTLSRVSYYQAQIAAHNASKYFWQKAQKARYSNISSYIHAVSPLGAVGLTEQEAGRLYGKKLKIYRYNYNSMLQAHIEKSANGHAKFICDDSGTLLGVHVLGSGADIIIDNVSIGQNFAEQFKDYLLHLRTSPNYLDLVWSASKKAEADCPRNLFYAILHYLKTAF